MANGLSKGLKGRSTWNGRSGRASASSFEVSCAPKPRYRVVTLTLKHCFCWRPKIEDDKALRGMVCVCRNGLYASIECTGKCD